MKKTIAIIGVGNMGGAMYRQLCKHMPPGNIFLCSHTRPAGMNKKTYFSRDPNDVISRAEIIMFAVKPQTLDAVIDSITSDLSKKIIISVLAGTTIKKLQKKTGAKKIIRTMPNLPVQVGKGVTPWVATAYLNAEEKNFARNIFSSFGYEIELQEEAMIDRLSVITGCGPAYFFALTEMLANAGKKIGFSQHEADTLAKATFLGTAQLFADGTKSAHEWRLAVTSKKGVTEAVLTYLKKKKVDEIFYQALQAGIKRSKKLVK